MDANKIDQHLNAVLRAAGSALRHYSLAKSREGMRAAMKMALDDAEAEANARTARLADALKFYAEGHHFILHDGSAWDNISGESLNFYEDESNTATVEDGSLARAAIDAIDAQQSKPDDSLTLDVSEVEFLAARVRLLLGRFGQSSPEKDDKFIVRVAGSLIGAMLANLEAASPAQLILRASGFKVET